MTREDVWNRAGDIGRLGLVGAAIAAPLARKNFTRSLNALVAILGTYAASKAIKAFWPAKRPNREDSNSFPSQHAGECFAAALSLKRQFGEPIGPAAVGLATAVGLTRIFGKKHRPADVIAGAAIGVTAGTLAQRLRG